MGTARILALERAAFEAWPAAEVRELGPWRLRFMHGVTRRANSVWAGPGEPPGGLDAGIALAQAFYAERSLPPLFQIQPLLAAPLDAALAARGYAACEPSSVRVADAVAIARLDPPAGIRAACDPELSEPWFEVSGRRGRFRADEQPAYRGLLERVAGRAGFAHARLDGADIGAVGLAVVSGTSAGIFSMLTLPAFRRRGLARAVLGALARFALERGARQLYLQVERDNRPALTLYEAAGFAESHTYHYRSRGA